MINWNFKNKNYSPIGLDITCDSVKMIQLGKDQQGFRIVAADKKTIDYEIADNHQQREDFIVSTIQQFLSENNYYGSNVVSCLRGDQLQISNLRSTETDDAQLKELLRKEAMDRFGFDSEKDSLDYLLAGSVKQGEEIKNEIIFFAVNNEMIKRHLGIIEKAHLRSVSVEPAACALSRNFDRLLKREEDKNNTTILIDIGRKFTLVVFKRGDQISFIKQIPLGEEDINHEISSRLGISFSEAQLLRKMLGNKKDPMREEQGEFENDELISDNQITGAFETSQQQTSTCDTVDIQTHQAVSDAIMLSANKLAYEISLCFGYYTVTFRGKRVEKVYFSGEGAYESNLLNVLENKLAVEAEIAQPLRGIDMGNVKLGGDRRSLHCDWAVAVGLSFKGWNENIDPC